MANAPPPGANARFVPCHARKVLVWVASLLGGKFCLLWRRVLAEREEATPTVDVPWDLSDPFAVAPLPPLRVPGPDVVAPVVPTRWGLCSSLVSFMSP